MKNIFSRILFCSTLISSVGIAMDMRSDLPIIGLSNGRVSESPYPAYSLQIYRDGRVTYTGSPIAKTKGIHELRIVEASVQKILKEFDRVQFVTYRPEVEQVVEKGYFLLSYFPAKKSLPLDPLLNPIAELIEQEVGVKTLVCPLDAPYSSAFCEDK